MMKKETPRFGTSFLIIAVAGVCIIIFFVGNFISTLPTKVEEVFGPASANLTFRDRYSLSLQLWMKADDLLNPANIQGAEVDFSIALEEPVSEVIRRLAQNGLISNASAFRDYLIYAGLDNQIQAGDYKLSAAMTPIEIAHEILDATPEFIPFSILAGWRLEEIAEALPSSGLNISIEDFLRAAHNPTNGYSFSGQIPKGMSIEGFLMPGTYELSRDLSAEELIAIILNRLEESLSAEIREGLLQQGLTLREGIIVASIVEREAVVAEEQSMIASVFHNRLAVGIALEADPTVQYALGYNSEQLTWWTNPLSAADLNFDSPYNSYVYGGLPPGPIANPSLEAIIAVAFPAETPFFYFRAACDESGKHNFSETFDQHKANAC